MEETLQTDTAFMFADDTPAADILSRLLLICGCEKNVSKAAAGVFTITVNSIAWGICGVKGNVEVIRGNASDSWGIPRRIMGLFRKPFERDSTDTRRLANSNRRRIYDTLRIGICVATQ